MATKEEKKIISGENLMQRSRSRSRGVATTVCSIPDLNQFQVGSAKINDIFLVDRDFWIRGQGKKKAGGRRIKSQRRAEEDEINRVQIWKNRGEE